MDANLEVIIIVAVSKNGVIGKEGSIPWYLPDDLKNFKKITQGHTVVMGRKTYESIGHALPNRTNIVLTRRDDFHPGDCFVANSLEEVLVANSLFKKECYKIFIIGGESVYRDALPLASKMILTEVDMEVMDGDAFFPEWNEASWIETSRKQFSGFMVRELDRKEEFCVLENARLEEQLGAMKKINAEGFCPFCFENFFKTHTKPIVWQGEYWFATENQWPYSSAKKHFLIISMNHAEKFADLSPDAGIEFIQCCQYLEATFGIKSGGTCMRFGIAGPNGATVDHLHAHFLEPDPENSKPLFFWIDTKKPLSF